MNGNKEVPIESLHKIYVDVAAFMLAEARKAGATSNPDFLTLSTHTARELLVFVCSCLDLEGRQGLLDELHDQILSIARSRGGSLGLLATSDVDDLKTRAEKDPEFKAFMAKFGINL